MHRIAGRELGVATLTLDASMRHAGKQDGEPSIKAGEGTQRGPKANRRWTLVRAPKNNGPGVASEGLHHDN
jgi:hypothetical protein